MAITVELTPEIESALVEQAAALGMDVTQYATSLLERAAHPKNDLVEFFRKSPLVGLELEFERDRDTGRDIDL
jgi:hypothetical protein